MVLFGILYTTLLGMSLLIIVGELAISAWLMTLLAYRENNNSPLNHWKRQNIIQFEQKNGLILANNDNSCS